MRRIGDTVLVRKAGEIIPEVISVRQDKRQASSIELVYPTNCPVCDTPLERTGTEVAYRCPRSVAVRTAVMTTVTDTPNISTVGWTGGITERATVAAAT